MKKVFFTAVLLTAGVAFASAQTTETKNNDETQKAEPAVDSATSKGAPAAEAVPATAKMTDPNADPEPKTSEAKDAGEQPADQAKKAERAKKK